MLKIVLSILLVIIPASCLTFDMPPGWEVVENNTLGNDTKIVISDGVSTIRIDEVYVPEITWLRNAFGGEIHSSMLDVLNCFYINQIIRHDQGGNRGSSSGSIVHPDSVDSVGYTVFGMGQEWVIVWIKPSYGDKFIGVYAIYHGEYNVTEINSYSRSYPMPKSFNNLVNSISTQN